MASQNYLQLDLTAAETIRGKQSVKAEVHNLGHHILAYHSDNGIFASAEFKDHCLMKKQALSFRGIGAHHQNGVAERSIKTISHLARANLIHLMLCWPVHCNTYLWPFAMHYTIWIYNCVPKLSLGSLSPDEFWSGVQSNHSDLCRAHVFGCHVNVLDPCLQDGHRIPKCDSWARQGMFVGFSSAHSSLVPLDLNLWTGSVSLQYHIIFNNKFQTVPSPHPNIYEIDNIFGRLFDTACDFWWHLFASVVC